MIFNIQHFCLDDGPGVRTTVFLKGCPLRCRWCHNPESHSRKKEILYDASLCAGCGACSSVCAYGARQAGTFDRSLCTACGKCAAVCPANALECAGREVAAEEIIKEVLRDMPFYDASLGGLTLSGGEPLLQSEFALNLLTEAKKAGLHTCVETCGYGSAEWICNFAEVTDLFLYDWKLTDTELHKYYTGVGNERIKENLLQLDSLEKPIVLRCPVIPGVNDTEDHFSGIAALANACRNIFRIELEPYHALGAEKCKRLGSVAERFRTPTVEELSLWQAKLAEQTDIEIKIG